MDYIFMLYAFVLFQILFIKDCKDISDNVCKIHTEFNYIKTMMYRTLQKIPQLVILLDGVKKEEVPDILKNRMLCQFPTSFHNDVETLVHWLVYCLV